MTVTLDGRSLGVDDLVAVARDAAPVELSADAVARMRRSREVLEAAAARGESIYGATTGVGALKRVDLDPAAVSRFNHTMILNCLVGQGPAVGEDVVRATLVRLANGFAGGATGVRPELAELTVRALNEGWPLEVRLRGSVGQADLAPLAELAAGLLDRSGFQLEAGEGLALIDNGSFSTALAGLAMADALQLADWLEAAAALDMEGFLANPSLLHRVLRERPYAGLQASAERLRLLLAGSALHDPGTPRNLQDPLTYRNIPQLHGALRDALAFAAGQLRIELNAAHSNPLVDVEEGRVLSVACFEILPLAAAIDFVRIALAPVLTSANERSMKLLHAGFSGLPAGLAAEPEAGDDGYTEFGVAGQALAAEARLLAAPVSFEMASSSQAEGIEDRMTMAPLAARRLAEMVDLGRRWSQSNCWWRPGRSTSAATGRWVRGRERCISSCARTSPPAAPAKPCRLTSAPSPRRSARRTARSPPQRRSSTRYVQPCSTSPQKEVTMRNPTKLSQLRSGRSEIENHVIDEFVSGHITRREFLRRGSIIGLSVPMLGAIVSACGGANSASSSGGGSAGGAANPGASLKIAGVVPTGAINPQSIADEGGLTMMQQTGETLVFNNPKTNLLEPVLATSWKSNEAGDVWTFKLRDGVTFNNGQPMTADDVVYSFQSQTDPKVYVNASSVFSGVLTNDGVEKVDDTTVAFNLEAPNGNFPYLISSDNYNMIIVPKGTDSRMGEDVRRHRPVRDEDVSAQGRRHLLAESELLGRQGAAQRAAVHLLPDSAAADPGAAGGQRRHRQPDRPPGRGGGPQRPVLQPAGVEVVAAP